jgi:chromate reductase, NAD(P)H dehydrogenase (quinone)
MTRILGISGSLRKASYNTALLRAAAALAPDGVTFEQATLHGIPLYDGDVEKRDGIPDAVEALKARVRASDGLLLVTPEYNNGIPGVFKNAIDWLSRPPADIPGVFGDKPVALIGATPGAMGTVLAQNAWLAVLRTLGTRPWFGKSLRVARAGNVFKDGELVDDEIRERLRALLAGFTDCIRRG